MKCFKILLSAFVLTSLVSFSFAAGTWVAKVDGKTITSSDLTQIIKDQQLLAGVTSGRSVDFMKTNKRFQKTLLETQIMQQLMVNEIKNINKQKKFISDAEILREKNVLSNLIEQALWIKAYSDKILRPQVTVSQQAIDKFYNDNKDQFKNATKDQANDFIKEELTLEQLKPLMMALQARIKSESSVNINDQYFGNN